VDFTESTRERSAVARALLIGATVVYALGLAVMALMPLGADQACAEAQWDVRRLADGIPNAAAPGHPLTDPAVLSLLVGFVAFLPLGVLLRIAWGRGVIVALLVGLGLSLLIELTQATGVWGLRECAYRVFDIVDVIANTVGAVVGSAITRLFVLRPGGVGAGNPTPVTRVRRAFGMTCDWVSVYFLGFVLTTPVAAAIWAFGGPAALSRSDAALDAAQTAIALAVTGAVALATRRTIGDHAARVAYGGGPLPPAVAAPLRYVAGIGGYQLLTAPTEGANPVSLAFVLGSIALLFVTADGRGLPGLASRQHVVDAGGSG
jgi:hypothetical protein